MNMTFEPLSMTHASAVMAIFNHYVETTPAPFPAVLCPSPSSLCS